MTTHNPEQARPLFTLQHGIIPDELLYPEYHQPGTMGWWVTGIDADMADESLPYVSADQPLRGGADRVAGRHFNPLVESLARRLLRVNHDIVVVDWHRLGSGVYEPEMQHVRHTMTISQVDGRARTFTGLSGAAVATVVEMVEQYEAGPEPAGEGGYEFRPQYTTVSLSVPVCPDACDEKDQPASSLVTIRIAAIVEVLQERYIEPVTSDDLAKMRSAYAADRMRAESKAKATV
jgi:hypothetical protein